MSKACWQNYLQRIRKSRERSGGKRDKQSHHRVGTAACSRSNFIALPLEKKIVTYWKRKRSRYDKKVIILNAHRLLPTWLPWVIAFACNSIFRKAKQVFIIIYNLVRNIPLRSSLNGYTECSGQNCSIRSIGDTLIVRIRILWNIIIPSVFYCC